MGKGGGSSKSVTYNTIDVKPVTNVEFDTEEIANAIKDSSGKQLAAEQIKLKLTQAGLNLKAQQQEQQAKESYFEFMQDEKIRTQLTIAALIIGGTLLYKQMKKGKS